MIWCALRITTLYDLVRNSLRFGHDRFLAIHAAVLKETCTSPLPDKIYKLLVICAGEEKCEPFEYDCVER